MQRHLNPCQILNTLRFPGVIFSTISGYFTVNIALSQSWHERRADKQQLAALCGCCQGSSPPRCSWAEISAGLQPSLAGGIRNAPMNLQVGQAQRPWSGGAAGGAGDARWLMESTRWWAPAVLRGNRPLGAVRGSQHLVRGKKLSKHPVRLQTWWQHRQLFPVLLLPSPSGCPAVPRALHSVGARLRGQGRALRPRGCGAGRVGRKGGNEMTYWAVVCRSAVCGP